MDLIRQIMLAVYDSDKPVVAGVDGISEKDFIHHAQLLSEAGLVRAVFAPENAINAHTAAIYRLTWEGYDFVDLIQDDTIWKKAKEVVIEKTGSWAFETLVDYLKDGAKSALPLAYGLLQVAS